MHTNNITPRPLQIARLWKAATDKANDLLSAMDAPFRADTDTIASAARFETPLTAVQTLAGDMGVESSKCLGCVFELQNQLSIAGGAESHARTQSEITEGTLTMTLIHSIRQEFVNVVPASSVTEGNAGHPQPDTDIKVSLGCPSSKLTAVEGRGNG